ncbi:phosphoglycolate phosphatase [Steroidobacter sp. S1-65]|uniref:Phosphoglycolate phosphatase n=1 Tax=Steroidobacter gossypii TaxID=2805490 RepID=A0ABS1X136_9GAMM|nr:phosphoglycolate phosphatase [Steroidobacter gossypii]MBM0106946.1 phosphoglycolate phosphatase [Steroidobacter gossypii]
MPKLIDCIDAVCFDLDGTLVDTAPDLTSAANMMLLILGGRPLPEERVAAFIGGGIDEFVAKVVEASHVKSDPAQHAAANALFRNLYGQRVFQHSRVYAGVEQTLRALHGLGRKLFCVTNKESRFTLPLLRSAGLSGFFASVLCADRLEDRKPSPNMLLAACNDAGVSPSRTLLVGDSGADVGAAQAAGCRVVAVDYGYHGGVPLAQLQPDGVVSRFQDILELSVGAQQGCHALRAIA